MNAKDQADFLKQTRLDIGDRHKKKRLEITNRWGYDHDREAIEPLTNVITNQQDDPDVRLASVQTLGFINDPQSVSTLAAILANPAMAEFHAAAIAALGKIGTEQAAHTLIASWEQVPGAKQYTIQQALTQLEPEIITGLLIEALGHPSAIVREQTAATLKQVEGSTPRLVAALGHENSQVRNGAQSYLVQMGKPVVLGLTAVLGSPDERIQTGAVEALIKIGKPAIEDLLVMAMGDDESAAAAANVLIGIGEPTVKPLIMASAAYPQTSTILLEMKESIKSVLKDADEDDIPLLITVLGFADEDLCQTVSEKLVEIGKPTISHLLTMLAADDDKQTQAAYNILAELGDKAIDPLIENLDDARIGAQVEALLKKTGEAVIVPLYNKLMLNKFNDPDCVVQNSVIELMCVINGSDRLAVAINLYHRVISGWANIFGDVVYVKKMLDGSMTYKDQMYSKNLTEESIQFSYTMKGYVGTESAIAGLQALADIAPKFALPYYWLGQWYLFKLEDTEKAIHAFEVATQSDVYLFENRQAQSYWWLGVCYGEPSSCYDYEKSMDCFQRTIELGWDDPLVYQAIQMSAQQATMQSVNDGKNPRLFLQALQKKEEALVAFVEREPDREEAIQLLQDTQNVLKTTEQTYQQLGEEKGFAHLRSMFLIEDAKKMSRNGQHQEAITLLRTLGQEYPDDININFALGEIYLQSGRAEQGLAYLQQYISPQPATIDLIGHLIQSSTDLLDQTLDRLIARQNFADAMALLENWESLITPTCAIPEQRERENLGVLLNRLTVRYNKIAHAEGNPWTLRAYEKSIKCIETAVSLSPTPNIISNMPVVYQDMGTYLVTKGQFTLAIEYYKKAVNIDPDFNDYTWWILSRLYEQLGDIENCMFCAMKAAEMGNPEALAMLRSLSR